jgi:hypothetical protein
MITKYDVAAIAAINGLDDAECHKLTAQQQREIFGFVAVGRKDISFDPRDQGMVRVGRSVNGNDYVWRDYSYEEFAQCINDRKSVEAW